MPHPLPAADHRLDSDSADLQNWENWQNQTMHSHHLLSPAGDAVFAGILVPITLCVVLGVAALLAQMGDAAGGAVLYRIALAGGILWVVDLICLLLLLAIGSLSWAERARRNASIARISHHTGRNANTVFSGADIPVCPIGRTLTGRQECLPHCGEKCGLEAKGREPAITVAPSPVSSRQVFARFCHRRKPQASFSTTGLCHGSPSVQVC